MGIIVLGGISNGCFALPMKYSRRWQWENTWLVFCLLALLILPWVLALQFVPRLGALYHAAPAHLLLLPLMFGFLWGIAQVTFGVSIKAIGMAIAIAVVQGVQTPLGSLIPLLAADAAALLQPRGLLLLASLPIVFTGLFLYGMAGKRREKEQAEVRANEHGMSFIAGLGIAVFTGVFGANLNLGFACGGGLITRSAQLGANPATATYPVWALVLGAGFIPNLLYCAFLIFRNRTWSLFKNSGWTKEFMLSLAMALLWLGGIILYGIGANLIGAYGTSVGFVAMTSSVLLAASAAGIFAGEWKFASLGTKKLLAGGIASILVSIGVLSVGGVL